MTHKNNTLDNLWEYIDTANPYASDEERGLMESLVNKAEALEGLMSAEQTVVFEDYADALSELHSVELREAFKKGIRFATGYILESLRSN